MRQPEAQSGARRLVPISRADLRTQGILRVPRGHEKWGRDPITPPPLITRLQEGNEIGSAPGLSPQRFPPKPPQAEEGETAAALLAPKPSPGDLQGPPGAGRNLLVTSQQLKIPAEFSILGVDWKGKARAGKCEATGTGGTLLKSPGLRRKFKARPREVPEFPNQEAARSTSTSRAEILPEPKALPQSSPLPPPQNARFKVFSTES